MAANLTNALTSHPNTASGKGNSLLQHQKLVKQSQRLVSQTFFGTLLKQMEESPFKSEMFSGGKGGQAFSSMYHQRLVEHMSKASGRKLVQGIVRKIEAAKHMKANEAYGKQQVQP